MVLAPTDKIRGMKRENIIAIDVKEVWRKME